MGMGRNVEMNERSQDIQFVRHGNIVLLAKSWGSL